MPSDIDLLAIETDTLWTKDHRGRLVASRGRSGMPAPHLSIGAASGACTLAFGADVPDEVARSLSTEIAGEALPEDTAREPAVIASCERLLQEVLGKVERSSGRAWIIESVPAARSDAAIVKSTDPEVVMLRDRVPDGFTWEADEWHDLIVGKLGAWAMCTVDGSPVSLCHCSRIADAGIEAGVWTHPDRRGRGYAAAATAAWAALVLPTGRHIFYSTNAGNRSSERVTERLGLRSIGWRWMLREAS